MKSLFIPLVQRGKKRKEFSIESPKALFPLKKGGQEGFLARAVQSAKVLQIFKLFFFFINGKKNPVENAGVIEVSVGNFLCKISLPFK